MQNQWPYKKRMPERAGEGSRAFDGQGATGKPNCEYEDKDLGEFGGPRKGENLNVKSGAGWNGEQPDLPGGTGIKFGASSSVTEHGDVPDLAKPGQVQANLPRAQKLAPHSK